MVKTSPRTFFPRLLVLFSVFYLLLPVTFYCYLSFAIKTTLGLLLDSAIYFSRKKHYALCLSLFPNNRF